MKHAASGHTDHHAHMAADFRFRFWIALALTLPILALSPMLQTLVGLENALRFPGDAYVQFGFASAVFWYGGWPFLTGMLKEIKSRRPGMMTLVDAQSEHPNAKAIAAASDKKLSVEGFKSIPGKGVEGKVDGKLIRVVSPGFLREQQIEVSDARVAPLQAQARQSYSCS